MLKNEASTLVILIGLAVVAWLGHSMWQMVTLGERIADALK